MKTLNVMLKPASSLCNMRCLYCFYADEAARRAVPSYGMMTEGTADMLIERVSAVLDQGDAVQYIFQGGEPTLRGLAFFERFAQKATEGEQLRVSFSLQTNGLLLDDAWCDFLLKYRVLVGVSLDLLPECHDKARKDAAGEGTYTRVTETIALLRRRGVPFNVLCTLTDEIAARPKQVWQRLLRLDVTYVQFTPCLGDEGCASYGRLSPHLFAEFYIRLFEFWYDDYKKGRGGASSSLTTWSILWFWGDPPPAEWTVFADLSWSLRRTEVLTLAIFTAPTRIGSGILWRTRLTVL